MILIPGAGQRKLIYKETNQNVISSTVLVDDELLQYPVDMDHRYRFEADIPFRLLGVASGYKFGITAPGEGFGTSIQATGEVLNGVTGAIAGAKVDLNAPFTMSGALATIGVHVLRIKGMVLMATGFFGVLKFQFAQNVSDVNAIRVLAGANIEIEDFA
jgi:hypothetical protein